MGFAVGRSADTQENDNAQYGCVMESLTLVTTTLFEALQSPIRETILPEKSSRSIIGLPYRAEDKASGHGDAHQVHRIDAHGLARVTGVLTANHRRALCIVE